MQRKLKSRRLNRGQVLNVKFRSEHARAFRVRILGSLLLLSLASSLSLLIFWRGGEWALNEFVFNNAAFNVQDVEVETDGIIAAQELRRWAGVKPGDNLLAIDMMRIRRDLELQPWVSNAVVERSLPYTL